MKSVSWKSMIEYVGIAAIENAAIWAKGNAGEEELSATEAVIYDALIQKLWAHDGRGKRGWRLSKSSEKSLYTVPVGVDMMNIVFFDLGGRRTWCQNEGYQGHAAIICDYFRGHEDYLASFCRE